MLQQSSFCTQNVRRSLLSRYTLIDSLCQMPAPLTIVQPLLCVHTFSVSPVSHVLLSYVLTFNLHIRYAYFTHTYDKRVIFTSQRNA